MIKASKTLTESFQDIYRDQGLFKFSLITNYEYPEYVLANYNTGDGHVYENIQGKTPPVIDRCIEFDKIATLEDSRWLLDGTMHSVCVDNVTNDPNWDTAYTTGHAFVSGRLAPSTDTDMPLGYRPTVKLLWGDYDTPIPLPGYEDYIIPIEDLKYPVSDRVTFIWDAYEGPMKFRVEMMYLDDEDESHTAIYIYSKPYGMGSNTVLFKDMSVSGTSISGKVRITSLEVSVIRWSTPNHRIRLTEIIFGEEYSVNDPDRFTGGPRINVMNVEESKEVDELNNSVPIYKCTITLDNRDKLWDLSNPESPIHQLVIGASIFYSWGLKSLYDGFDMFSSPECLKILSWEAPSNCKEFKLTLASEWQFMSGTGNISASIKSFPFDNIINNLAREIIYRSRYNSLLKANYFEEVQKPGSINLYNSTPSMPRLVDCKESFQLISQAAGSALTVNSSTGLVEFQDMDKVLNNDSSVKIPENALLSEVSLNYAEKLKKITCKLYSLTAQDIDTPVINVGAEDVGKTYNVAYALGNLTYIGNTEYASGLGVQIDFVGSTGRSQFIELSNLDTGYSSGWFQLHVKAYQENSYEYMINGDTEGSQELSVDNNYITDSSWINRCTQPILKIMQNNKSISLDTLGNPLIEPWDIVECETSYGIFRVLVTKVSTRYNGAFRGTVSGRILEV